MYLENNTKNKMNFSCELAKDKLKIVNKALKYCYGSRNTIKMFLGSDKPKFAEMNFLSFQEDLGNTWSNFTLIKTKH